MARRQRQEPYEASAIIDYSKAGVKPLGPHDPPRAEGRTNPRHDWMTRMRLDHGVKPANPEDNERWSTIEDRAQTRADDDRRVVFRPVEYEPQHDWLGRSVR
jgi:hypothetical protein